MRDPLLSKAISAINYIASGKLLPASVLQFRHNICPPYKAALKATEIICVMQLNTWHVKAIILKSSLEKKIPKKVLWNLDAAIKALSC